MATKPRHNGSCAYNTLGEYSGNGRRLVPKTRRIASALQQADFSLILGLECSWRTRLRKHLANGGYLNPGRVHSVRSQTRFEPPILHPYGYLTPIRYCTHMHGNTPEAYSRLRIVLAKMNLSVFQLHKRLQADGVAVNRKSLYRLASDEPIQKIDLRIAAAICKACSVALGDLVTLEKPVAYLQRLDAKTQDRLDTLMAKNNEGSLTTTEKREFERLAEKAHQLSMDNARVLITERRRSERSRGVRPALAQIVGGLASGDR